ncbi:hypothetical protein M3689_11080 [Alkalihalophilus marmarensis]|jgi:hypothetical protein|uniref:hypothetical protein n=1 Tax=Alkalihalophilus marmarensis TaxID=521377 RepID=UPI002040B520|nr:hypothetical protein [Alkalihalophilus marmarensis]MCM3489851.1 hypothetical protein [Alkalihalophilus marmarensis]
MKKLSIYGGTAILIFIIVWSTMQLIGMNKLEAKNTEIRAVSLFNAQVKTTNGLITGYLEGDMPEEVIVASRISLQHSFDSLSLQYSSLQQIDSTNYREMKTIWNDYLTFLYEEPSEPRLEELLKLEEEFGEVLDRVFKESHEQRRKLERWKTNY